MYIEINIANILKATQLIIKYSHKIRKILQKPLVSHFPHKEKVYLVYKLSQCQIETEISVNISLNSEMNCKI